MLNGHVTHLGEMQNLYRIFIRKHEGKTTSEVWHRLKDIIVFDFKDRVKEGMN
jgi:hypothetical protein